MTQARPHSIEFRVSTDERAQIDARAAARGMTRSAYLRDVGTGAAQPVGTLTPAVPTNVPTTIDGSAELVTEGLRVRDSVRIDPIRRILRGLRTRRPRVWSR